jgi:hypothetical protein
MDLPLRGRTRGFERHGDPSRAGTVYPDLVCSLLDQPWTGWGRICRFLNCVGCYSGGRVGLFILGEQSVCWSKAEKVLTFTMNWDWGYAFRQVQSHRVRAWRLETVVC